MGKGDKKSKRGKLFKGSFGNSRKSKIEKADVKPAVPAAPVVVPKKKSA